MLGLALVLGCSTSDGDAGGDADAGRNGAAGRNVEASKTDDAGRKAEDSATASPSECDDLVNDLRSYAVDHRACDRDDDCVLVGEDCGDHDNAAVNRDAADAAMTLWQKVAANDCRDLDAATERESESAYCDHGQCALRYDIDYCDEFLNDDARAGDDDAGL